MLASCNLKPPYRHAVPVHHAVMQVPVAEWPDECVWWQLKAERYEAARRGDGYASTLFLAGLEAEWAGRRLCSRCLREIDEPLAEQFGELQLRTASAEDKLGRIRKALMEKPDIFSRPAVMRILDEP